MKSKYTFWGKVIKGNEIIDNLKKNTKSSNILDVKQFHIAATDRHTQLGNLDKVHVFKGLFVCWMLLNIISLVGLKVSHTITSG